MVSDKPEDHRDGVEARGRTDQRVRADAKRNLDALLQDYPAAVGIKPGWTGNAGACLIGMAVRGGHHLLAVLLSANYPARLESQLFDWGFGLDGLPPLLPRTPTA